MVKTTAADVIFDSRKGLGWLSESFETVRNSLDPFVVMFVLVPVLGCLVFVLVLVLVLGASCQQRDRNRWRSRGIAVAMLVLALVTA